MTLAGGVLVVLDGRQAGRNDGFTVPALAASGASGGVEAVFNLPQGRALDRERWTSIVIHHSGSPSGDAERIAAEHRRQGFAGLGHHFIIGNGAGMDDGEIRVGYRWRDQLPGAHAGGPRGDYYNNHAISICLVGNGDRQRFTKAQMSSLVQLVRALSRELKIPLDAQRVLLHNDIVPATSDPGQLFPEAQFRLRLAEGG
jgi:N-acetyl-anhydromuramyl-L-alanine amidase AmpD